jgi:hypothetical protein
VSAACRPIGKFGGGLASLTETDMGVVAAEAAREHAGIGHPELDVNGGAIALVIRSDVPAPAS